MKFDLDVRHLFKIWQKLSFVPGGALIFSKLIGKFVPYTGSVAPIILELKPGHARIQMQDRRRVRNHLGSIHAAALMNFAEAASGLAINGLLPQHGRAILVSFNIHYLKKARGPLTADSQVSLAPLTGPRDEVVVSVVTNAKGDVVARAEATWRLDLMKEKVS